MKKIPSDVQWVHLQAVGGDSVSVKNTAYGNEQPKNICEKMITSVNGIIFDFDGTLFDNSRIAFYLISANPVATLRTWKERLVRKRFAGRDFQTPEKYFKAFFKELGKACCQPPEWLRNWYFNHYMPRMIRVLKKHYNAREGLQDLLQRAGSPGSSLKIAVYSDYPFLKERMEAIGLSVSENIRLYGPESFGAQKPASRPFLEIAKNMNLQPEEILVIGDREDTDGQGAFNAGMHFFCLETNNKRYNRFDPYRRKPNEEMQGPTLLMYAGAWDGLINLLLKRVS